MTRKALAPLAPDPVADLTAGAPLTPAAKGDAAPTGDVTGIHHLRLLHHPHLEGAGPPLVPGPAPTLVATGFPRVVAAVTTAEMAAAATLHRAATGPALAPTAARPRQTGTHIADARGPAPGLPAVGAGTGGLRAGSDAGFPDPRPEPTEAAQDPGLEDAPSV